MKHSSKISMISVLCALCVCAAGSANGASSVRALGGSGTISGTAAASGTATSVASTGAGVSRAGSVRVTPTSTQATTAKSTTVSTNNASAARGATTSRLSVGKYLNKVVSNNSNKLGPSVSVSTSTGNTNISSEVTQIVGALQGNVDKLQGEIQDLRDDSHRAPVSGDSLVEISSDNEISINVAKLADALSDKLDIDAGTIDIIVRDDKGDIAYCHSTENEQCDYTHIISLSELRGPEGPQGPQGEKGDSVSMEDLALLMPQLEQTLTNKINTAIAELNLGALATRDTVGTEQIDNGVVTEEKLSEDVQNKLNNAIADIGLLGTELEKKQDALSDDQMAVLDSGITADAVTQIGLNTANITENAAEIAKKANAADVYTTAEIDSKLEGITAGSVAAAPDNSDYAWVSLGGKQQWVSIAGANE